MVTILMMMMTATKRRRQRRRRTRGETLMHRKIAHLDALADPVDELVGSHVGAAPFSEDSEETKASNWQAVQVGVSVREELTRLLRRRVRRYRLVDGLVLAEVEALGATVDGGRGGKDEVLDLEFGSGLEEGRGPPDV